MSSDMTRRTFLQTASVTAAAASVGAETSQTVAAAGSATSFSKTRILRIYLVGRPSWPRPDLDIEAEHKRIEAEIDKAPGCRDVEFVGNMRVNNPGMLARHLEQFNDVDGILAVQLCLGTSFLINVLADVGKPTILFAIPYSGHEWCIVPDLQKAGKKIDVIPTSDFQDAAKAIRVFRAMHRLKETRLLFVGGGWVPPEAFLKDVKSRLGVEIVPTEPAQLVEAYEAIGASDVEVEAKRWTNNAEAIKEPSHEEILKSSRFSLGLQKVLADTKAQAVTINCLGLFGQGKLPAYPCLGFARLNDLGLVGVCEADLASSLTQIIYQHMEGVPGFVTDPVFDTSNNTVIHAHCVSATKMDGPDGPACPYVIRSHLEDNKGASLQVKMRKGQKITMAKLVGSDPRTEKKIYMAATPTESLGTGTMLLSTGTIVDVPGEDRGCRTKVTTRVRDARQMLEQWTHGLHRVIFYGDHVEDTRRLARFLEFDVVDEG